VLIRCEKCSTLYELDEKLLPPGGAPVQCSKCQYVFHAQAPSPGAAEIPAPPAAAKAPAAAAPPPPEPPREAAAPPPSADGPVPASPPSAAASRPAPAPTPPPAAEARPEPPRSTPPPGGPRPGAGSATTSSTSIPAPQPSLPADRFTPDGRPIRKIPFPDEVESASSAGPRPMIARAPGRIGASPRGSARPLRWAIPVALALLAVVAVLAGRAVSKRVDPAAARRRADGLALLRRDDQASLAAAAVAFTDAAQLDASLAAARADRALAHALMLGLAQAEASRADGRLAERQAERAGAEGQGPPPPPALTEAVDALRAQRDAVRARVRQLENDTEAELTPLRQSLAGEAALVRAQALFDAFATDAERAERVVRQGDAFLGKDVWLDLAVGAADVRAALPERRAEGVARLEALVAAHPDLLRGRLVLAEALAQAGRTADAVAALDAVLAANPRHEGAQALKTELTAARDRPAQGEAQPSAAPPPGTPAPLERKDVSHAQTKSGG
jgi:predicted Zn finger-like uncharacterized protein